VEARFLAELTRRRVFRALIAYGIVAFAVLQVIEPIMHGLHWPDAVLSYVVIALALGFPVVVALAWAFDVNAARGEGGATAGARPRRRRLGLVLALVGLAALAAAPVVYSLTRRPSAPGSAAGASIAVLPFTNLGADKDNEYFSDGITEDLINDLANIEGLRVASRTAVFAIKGKAAGVQEIGNQLNVQTLLEGSVRREGSSLRVTAQLINVSDGFHLWSKSYDRELKSIFAVEEEIAGSIAEALRRKLVGLKPATSSVEAHDLYLRGLFFANKRNPEALHKAADLYQQAIAADPGYALAYAGLADTLVLRSEYDAQPAAEMLPKARAAAKRALEIDPRLAEAHSSLGLAAALELDWATALNEQRTAIELKPDYAMAHNWYAIALAATGRLAEAHQELVRARQLDPTSLVIYENFAYGLEAVHDYKGAAEQFRRTLELDPGFAPARSGLAVVLALSGAFEEALAEVDKLPRGANTYGWETTRALVLALAGRREEARALLQGVQGESKGSSVPYFERAAVEAALGDDERALSLLEQSCSAHEQALTFVNMHPVFDGLRSHQRYQDLLRCAHLK
jgi:serine/threonine-protein kinase